MRGKDYTEKKSEKTPVEKDRCLAEGVKGRMESEEMVEEMDRD